MFETIYWAVIVTVGFGALNAIWISLFLKAEALRENPVEQQEPLALALAAPFAHAHS